jgi:hypothetical protein
MPAEALTPQRIFFMKKKLVFLAMSVMLVAFGKLVAGCDDGSTAGSTEASETVLDGMWSGDGIESIKFNDGNYEVPGSQKGTYTTKGNILTLIPTHVHGDNMEDEGILESRWYTKSELKAALGDSIDDETLNETFASLQFTYSVNGNKLTLTIDGETLILTKTGGGEGKTPVAGDYTIGNLEQTAGDVTEVTISPKSGKSPGTVTVKYDGSATVPQEEGSYAVTFDVEAASGWKAATGLSAGTLIVDAGEADGDSDGDSIYNKATDFLLNMADEGEIGNGNIGGYMGASDYRLWKSSKGYFEGGINWGSQFPQGYAYLAVEFDSEYTGSPRIRFHDAYHSDRDCSQDTWNGAGHHRDPEISEIMDAGQGKQYFYVKTSDVQMWSLAMSYYSPDLGGSGTYDAATDTWSGTDAQQGDGNHGAALMIITDGGYLDGLARVFCTNTDPSKFGYTKLSVESTGGGNPVSNDFVLDWDQNGDGFLNDWGTVDKRVWGASNNVPLGLDYQYIVIKWNSPLNLYDSYVIIIDNAWNTDDRIQLDFTTGNKIFYVDTSNIPFWETTSYLHIAIASWGPTLGNLDKVYLTNTLPSDAIEIQ